MNKYKLIALIGLHLYLIVISITSFTVGMLYLDITCDGDNRLYIPIILIIIGVLTIIYILATIFIKLDRVWNETFEISTSKFIERCVQGFIMIPVSITALIFSIFLIIDWINCDSIPRWFLVIDILIMIPSTVYLFIIICSAVSCCWWSGYNEDNTV